MKIWKYRHYKNKEYEVFWEALHSETWEKLVLYKPLYDCLDLEKEFSKRPFFVRPYDMFHEEIIINNELKKRFEYIWR